MAPIIDGDNKVLKLSLIVFIVLVLTGCMHTNTQIPDPAEYSVPELDIKQPVTIRNGVQESGEIRIGQIRAWRVYGDLYKFTESAIGVATNILEKNHIKVQNGADKVLELSVYDAKSELGEPLSGSTFTETIALKVSAGDRLTKECTNMQKHNVLFTASRAIERALAKCVVQMLSDKEIIRYLKNNDEEYYSPQNSFDDGDEYYSPEE